MDARGEARKQDRSPSGCGFYADGRSACAYGWSVSAAPEGAKASRRPFGSRRASPHPAGGRGHEKVRRIDARPGPRERVALCLSLAFCHTAPCSGRVLGPSSRSLPRGGSTRHVVFVAHVRFHAGVARQPSPSLGGALWPSGRRIDRVQRRADPYGREHGKLRSGDGEFGSRRTDPRDGVRWRGGRRPAGHVVDGRGKRDARPVHGRVHCSGWHPRDPAALRRLQRVPWNVLRLGYTDTD